MKNSRVTCSNKLYLFHTYVNPINPYPANEPLLWTKTTEYETEITSTRYYVKSNLFARLKAKVKNLKKESQNIIEASPERQANIRLVLPLRLCLELIHQVNILFPRCLPPLYYRYCQTISHCHPIFLLFFLPKNSLLCCREQQLHKSDDEKISATLAISSPSSSVDDLPVGLAVQRRAFTFPNLKNLAGRTRTVSERAEEKDQVFYRLGYVLLIWESRRWER